MSELSRSYVLSREIHQAQRALEAARSEWYRVDMSADTPERRAWQEALLAFDRSVDALQEYARAVDYEVAS